VWLANCYFAHDSSGFPSCADSAMQSGRAKPRDENVMLHRVANR